jgi:hypothetical protein
MVMWNFTREELETLYQEILFKLTAAFPPNTVEFKTNNKASAYIPSHPYKFRVRSTAGPYWSWKPSIERPIYHEESDEIEMRGVLTILTSSCEGQGFAKLDRSGNDKQIRFYKESIRAALSDAFRDAADGFGIGHVDLAPYREWAKNPGTGLVPLTAGKKEPEGDTKNNEVIKEEVKYCKKCGKVLTRDDLNYLEVVKWSNQVCKEDVPKHQKKKFDPEHPDYKGRSK